MEMNVLDIISMLNTAKKLEDEEIAEEKDKGHFVLQKVPSQMSKADLLFNEILNKYLLFSKSDKEETKKLITTEMAWYLLGFGIRMATYSLRLSSQKYFINGLTSIGMTLGILDQREILVTLSLFQDVQKRKGLLFNKIFKQKDEFSFLLEAFINRDEKDKSLECMGYFLETDEENTLTYKRIW